MPAFNFLLCRGRGTAGGFKKGRCLRRCPFPCNKKKATNK